MTITIPLWVIPALLTLFAVVSGTLKAINDNWEYEGVGVGIAIILLTTYIIWTTYFTILYFLR